MSSGKVLLGTLAGLAIGAIAGILYAPEKGSTTRKQIKNKSGDYVDDLKVKFDEFRNSLAAKVESSKKEIESFVEKGKSKYDDAKQDMKNNESIFKHDGVADTKRGSL